MTVKQRKLSVQKIMFKCASMELVIRINNNVKDIERKQEITLLQIFCAVPCNSFKFNKPD